LAEPRTVISGRQRALGFSVTVIPLRFTSASSVQRIVADIVPQERVFLADPTRNLLIFAGTGTESADLVELVRLFDVDWMAGMSFALFPVKVAEVTRLVSELEQVFGQGVEGPLQGVVRFVPIERMNAVLAISTHQGYLDRAALWVNRLDRGEETASRGVYVYYVQNSRAADLAEVLNQIFAEPEVFGRADAELAPGLTPVELTTPAALLQGEGGEAGAIAQAGGGAQAASAEAPYGATGRAGAVGRGAGVGVLVGESGAIKVIADERNNALVILATPAEYRMVEATLRRLDVVPLQVMLEATIAEVSLQDDLRYGLQWFFSSGNFAAAFTDLAGGIVGPAPVGFSAVFANSDARVILDALTEVTDVNVISSPQLMVLDNQSATLNVGDQVPIVTQSGSTTTSVDIIQSIEYRDTGVVLQITPRVNAGGLVVLDIIQEVSDAIETVTSGIDSPTIQQRRIESTVAVQSGETVAIGGLIRDTRADTVSGIPLLSEIPLLGNLFKTTFETIRRTELLVLITPRVVGNVEEARAVTQELRNRLSVLAPLERRVFGETSPMSTGAALQ
jgi:general secretion pathway protein D